MWWKNRDVSAILLVVIVLTAQFGNAQSHYRFQHYGINEGLGFEFAWGLEQDSLGFIWVSYFDQLCRFDGYVFKSYKYSASDSLRAKLNFTLGRPTRDSHKNIWYPIHRERPGPEILARHDYKTDGFIRLDLDSADIYVHQHLFERDSSFVWLGSGGKGIYSYNLRTGKTGKYLNIGSDGKPQRPYSISGMKNLGRSLLLATGFGLWVFDKTTKKYIRPVINLRDSSILYARSIEKILESPHVADGYTWLKLESSLVKIDSNFNIVQSFDFPEGVTMDQWARDSDGVFWLGCGWNEYKGLFRYDPRDSSIIRIQHDPSDPRSLPNNAINDLLVDAEQNLWVATEKGVSVLRRPDIKFTNSKVNEGTIWGNAIYRAKDAEYIILRNDPSSNKKLVISPLHTDAREVIDLQPFLDPIDHFVGWVRQGRNTFWISAQGRGVIGYPIDNNTGMVAKAPPKILGHDPQNSSTLRANAIWDIWEDPNEDLWVMQPFGLDRIRLDIPYGTVGSTTHYERSGSFHSIYPEDEHSFWVLGGSSTFLVHLPTIRDDSARFERAFESIEGARVIYKATDGRLFLGTSNGLYSARKTGSRYELNSEPIFSRYPVISVQEDKLGRLWIDSDTKLLCYDGRNNVTTEFDERDGIDHFRDLMAQRMHRLTDGTLLVVGAYGITTFDPLTFHISSKNVIPILTSLEVNNKVVTGSRLSGDPRFSIPDDITMLNELTLDFKHNNFTIEFSAMEMMASEKNVYKHKLDGYDNDWIESDFRHRTATYTNLDAGTYIFHVRATNHNGMWSDKERTLKVIILPPPWKSTWAYAGYALILATLLFGAKRNLVQRERLKSNLKLAKVEQEKEHFELEKAIEVDKVKSTFFANISHEFRTPLTLIKGPVQNLLEQFADHPNVKEQLKLVQRNSDLLLKLINQLLDLAKLESGNLTVEKSENDLNSFLTAIINSFSSLAFQKGIVLEMELPPSRNLARFDKDKVETILINLINNAIKFTPAGGTVTVKTEVKNNKLLTGLQMNGTPLGEGLSAVGFAKAEGLLKITVSDTGIGIPAEQQSKVFERFHQVSEAHKEVGTGIGLSLVKELVALMEGSLTLKSEPGKGSEFTVTLPVEVIHVLSETELVVAFKEQLAPEEFPYSGNGHELEVDNRPRILVVEDNGDLRRFIIDCLGNEFHFLEGADGKQGLEKAFEETPDLVISDVMMPEMDGITMTGILKKDPRTSHIPLILLTAKTSDESKLSGLGTGADDYLTKPFNKNELLLKVRNSIAARVKLREKIKLELLKESPKVEVQSEDEKFLYKVREAILNRLSDEQLSVESLAEEIGLSRSQLLRKITALTGTSVNELIRTFRLQKAAQLLEQNWGPVTQVAYEVGFSNLSYFSKVFKEQYGVLPSEYPIKTI